MQEFINDMRKYFDISQSAKTKVIQINKTPFYVNQKVLDRIRQQGIYEKYVNSVKKLIQKGDRSWID